MGFLYVDASALLRLLFDEPGERVPLQRGTIAVSSKIVAVECFRAIERVRLDGHLTDEETAQKASELLRILANLHLVAVSDEIIETAKTSWSIRIRALDAIHVATALSLGDPPESVQFWTHDTRQATAAIARGLNMRGTKLSAVRQLIPR